ncbi:hypothetical protein ACHAWC_006013 [Mediolabrus comicus]
MRVIPSILVLYIGSVTAQEPAAVTAVPAVATTTSSSTDPSAQDDPFGDISDLLGDLFGDDSGIGDMIDNIVDTVSDMFGGDGSSVQLPDLSDLDISDLDISDLDLSNLDLSGLAGDGTSTTSTSQLMDLGCPESCAPDNTDLCQIDFSMVMNPDPARVQQMCDTGCIPTAVLEACATADTVPATATSTAGAGVAGIIASVEGLCDFVNCCVDDGQAADAVVSPTRSKFEQCEGKLPMLSGLPASTTTADPDSDSTVPDLFDMGDFDMGDVQEIIENVMDGLEGVMDQFGDLLPEMIQGMFDSNSIPAFCADADTCDAPEGFCECFSGDLEKCNKEVIAQACTSDSFSKCAPQDYTDFCANECSDSSGSDVLHMCAMCNVVTCCGKENAEIEGCLSEAFTVAQTQMATMFEDLLDGVDMEGMIGEVLGDLESIKWCPEDKTCPEPFGQFCDIANGGPSSAVLDSGSTTDVSPRNNLDLQVIMGIDLDKMCSEDMIFGCGPVNMKEKCDSVCSGDGNDSIMKASFCRLCGIASCCEGGEEKTFESCSSAVYIPTDSSTPTSGSGQSNNQDSTSDPPKEEVPEVVDETNTASEAEDETAENGVAQLDVDQIVEEPQLEFSRLEKENSGMISSASFLTAAFSTLMVLALY